MIKHLIVILIVFSFSYSRAQESLEGCIQFALLEIWDESGKPISADMKENYKCLHDKLICFDSTVNAVIISNGENGLFYRILYDKKTQLRYAFRSDSTGHYVMIDSSMLSNSSYNKSGTIYEPTDSIKVIDGFNCRKYVSKSSGKGWEVQYEVYVAEKIPEFPGSSIDENGNELGLALETLSKFPEPSELRTRTGIIKFHKDFDRSLIKTDTKGYQIIGESEWRELVRRNR